MAVALILFFVNNSFAYAAYILIATETARGEYENGKFVKLSNGEFKYRFEVDEEKGHAKLTEITRLKDNSVIKLGNDYTITYIDYGGDLLTVKSKAEQKVICIVGNPGTLATETIILGEKFFEYSKAASNRFYLSTGIVEKSISPVEDMENQLKKGK